VAEIRRGDFVLQRAPLVLANILAPVIVRLFEDGLADLLEPQGVIVLSGILKEQVADVVAALERAGLRLLEQRLDGDWVALAVG
jgi:ribosomal protein L11 methyltransferase